MNRISFNTSESGESRPAAKSSMVAAMRWSCTAARYRVWLFQYRGFVSQKVRNVAHTGFVAVLGDPQTFLGFSHRRFRHFNPLLRRPQIGQARRTSGVRRNPCAARRHGRVPASSSIPRCAPLSPIPLKQFQRKPMEASQLAHLIDELLAVASKLRGK